MLHQRQDGAGPSSQTIADGDLVVLYERYDAMKAVTVDAKQNFQSRFGCFPMKDWVGKPFGSRVRSKQGQGWVYVLAMTPELWTSVLRHRTQILYMADIAMICAFLELRPGLTVLESGTGSGSLTHSLARAVAPTGRVASFEFHAQRAEQAAAEFASHGLADLVSVQQRDIEALGFPPDLHGIADAVFLDLPGPWNAVESAAQCLRPDGVFCSFSPCIEQVQRTCAALAAHHFGPPRTMECLLRKYDVFRAPVICNLEAAAEAASSAVAAPKKRKRGEQGGAAEAGGESGKGDCRQQVVHACPCAKTPGHTGYLTFARRAAVAAGQDADVAADENGGEDAGTPGHAT